MARDSKAPNLTLMQVVSFEVKGVTGDWKEVTGRWHELSRQCQGVANLFWSAWTAWHYRKGSYGKLKAWLQRREGKGHREAGKCPVDYMPAELSREIYRSATERFPAATTRLVGLVLQRVQRTMTSRAAVKGSLPGAAAILLHQESHPAYTRPFPILFDATGGMTRFIAPKEDGGNWKIKLKIWSIEKGKRHEDEIELWCKGRKVQSQLKILERIAAEEYTFKGSQLVYSQAKRKWFAKICYSMPKPKPERLNVRKMAVLSAADSHPLDLAMPDGQVKWLGGGGQYIAPVRRQLLMQRWDRQANYRYAGSAAKGHGRTRAGAGPQWKLRQRWKDFVKRVNRGVARQAIDWCVSAKVGVLLYEQPDGEFGSTRFLHNAGKVEGRVDSTGWDWFQLRTFLEQAAAKVGVEVKVVKVDGVEKNDEEEAEKPKGGAGFRAKKTAKVKGRK